MAMIMTKRRGLFGIRHSAVQGPSSEGTKAAFKAGEEAHQRSGGAKPGLKRAVAMHRASSLRAS